MQEWRPNLRTSQEARPSPCLGLHALPLYMTVHQDVRFAFSLEGMMVLVAGLFSLA